VNIINQIGLNEIKAFLDGNHKSNETWSDDMLRAWARDAEHQLSLGNPPTIEIKSGESIYGRTQEYTISSNGVDTL